MNIFVLDNDPIVSAQLQCDKHVVKMIVESAQMLSTAHRMLDGVEEIRPSKSGKTRQKYWRHKDSGMEDRLYAAVHVGHPCTIWTMKSAQNYQWHYQHFVALCDEYTYRYDKIHLTDKILREALEVLPWNIPLTAQTPFAVAMQAFPECIQEDPVMSYRSFYQTKQERFKMVWTDRPVPEWFNAIRSA